MKTIECVGVGSLPSYAVVSTVALQEESSGYNSLSVSSYIEFACFSFMSWDSLV